MKNKFSKSIVLLSLFFALNLGSVKVQAQCPMCKISAATNLRAGGTAGKGLNTGILYMFAMPYLMVGLLGFIWWRNKRKEEDIEFSEN